MLPSNDSTPTRLTRRGLLTAAAPVGAVGLWLPSSFAAGDGVQGGAVPNPQGVKWAKKRFAGDPGVGRVYYGSVVSTDTSIKRFESQVGHGLGAHRNFHQATQVQQLISRARADVAARRFSVLSIKPPGSWRSVAEGAHNAWLDQILDGLGSIDAPMAFTINHEPENDVDSQENSPNWHKRMTEHALARAANRAPRVHVIQILMQYTFRSGNGRNPRDWLAPSVELFGLDAYNYWSPGGSVEWISFKKMVSRAQEWADGKPVVIGEYGVRSDPRHPGRAAKWMKKAFNYASKHDVVAMNYFNTTPAGVSDSFALDNETLGAFKRSLHDDRSARLKYKKR